jgi:hypothetical protein
MLGIMARKSTSRSRRKPIKRKGSPSKALSSVGRASRRALKSPMAKAAIKKGLAAYDMAKDLVQNTMQDVRNVVDQARAQGQRDKVKSRRRA